MFVMACNELFGLVVPRSRGIAVVWQTCRLLAGGPCRLVSVPCDDTLSSVLNLCGSSCLDKRGRSAKLCVCECQPGERSSEMNAINLVESRYAVSYTHLTLPTI